MTPDQSSTEWRLQEAERRLGEIERLNPAVLVERVANLVVDIGGARDEIKTLKRALYTFALSISTMTVGFIVTALQLFGH